ncbi:unnamed protein product [Moneuplotes crassus]|uniref:Transmembrane protein n=1 Tax=Euplotes crassus TaxID=5936 RepID=A0AAD1Y8J5_EUPCR|nr:unnamed protein product [Moneuplotes crassus]
MSYFRSLQKYKTVVPSFWTDQSLFIRDGFIMGFTIEMIFLYTNMYDSFVRKATLKCLEQKRYFDYKLKEKKKLDEIRENKKKRIQEIQQMLGKDPPGESIPDPKVE